MPLPRDFEKQLFAAADHWTNRLLQPSEYSTPTLALG